MRFPADYSERVYAGVLGKLIGVFLGRPIEGWDHARIKRELGPINYYVHERLHVPLVVSDDDLSGTFTFIRAVEDYGFDRNLTPRQIGQTWLNYVIERRAMLYWGGMGWSSEDTAYHRLRQGVPAPRSGSMELNGRWMAEQIGAQIFIDGWAMVAPGDPRFAADLARRAGSVSHDGEALHAAAALAAMESLAFVEPDMNRIFSAALSVIPPDSAIARVHRDVRAWARADRNWEKTRLRIERKYAGGKAAGVVPEHALIVLALAYAPEDFQRALMIVNTAGWDTDCNSGNVGALLGIKNGLAGLEAGADFRGPVADRMLLPTADGGGAITDAATVAERIVRSGRRLGGKPYHPPKGGARFHFSLPGSVQGFQVEESVECRGTACLRNELRPGGERVLAVRYQGLAEGRRARLATPTFSPDYGAKPVGTGGIAAPALYAGYKSAATVYSGQSVLARVGAAATRQAPVAVCLFVKYWGEEEAVTIARGPAIVLKAGGWRDLHWVVPETHGAPIFEIGLEVGSADGKRAGGTVFLERLTWSGSPRTTLGRPPKSGKGVRWREAWVFAADDWGPSTDQEPFPVMQRQGLGCILNGTREWGDYGIAVSARSTLARECGAAVRVQGLRRYYALLLGADGKARLVKELDGRKILAEAECAWVLQKTYRLRLVAKGNRITAAVDGRRLFEVRDEDTPLLGGGIGLLCNEGKTFFGPVAVRPV